jgi:multidrug efflux system membrane fusion protein
MFRDIMNYKCEEGNSRGRIGQYRWLCLGFLLILLLLPACGKKKERPQEAVPVHVAPVVEKTIPVELKAIGNVEAYTTVGIKARIGGQLMQVNFKEGQDVKQGDLLFVIDPRPQEASLREAQANLAKDTALADKAQKDAVRYTDLVHRDFVSKQEYDQIRANAEAWKATVAADKVAVDNARLNLSYCYIKAPITGRTGNLMAFQGNMIKANEDNPKVVINQVLPIYVNFSVPEVYLADIKKYMAQGKLKVTAIISKDTANTGEGALTFVNNAVDKATGTILLKGTFLNEDRRLWPGQFVDVSLTLTTRPGAILAPSQAIQVGQQGHYVFVVKPDLTVEYRPVEAGMAFNGQTVVEKGLKAGETVVTDGQLRLVPGAKVEVKQNSKAGGAKGG